MKTGWPGTLLVLAVFLLLLTVVPAGAAAASETAAKPNSVRIECWTHEGKYLHGETRYVYGDTTFAPPDVDGYYCDSQEQFYRYRKNGGSGTVQFYYVLIEGSVTVYCIDNDEECFDSYKVAVYEDMYIRPREYDGYTLLSDMKYVAVDPSCSRCTPDSIEFCYLRNGSGGGSYTYGTAAPYYWDTQFKPGTSAPDKHNEKRYEKLSNICDGNCLTSFSWLIWQSERTDDVPELTAYFDGDTISSISIMNGCLNSESEYYDYARAASLRVVIYNRYGQRRETTVRIPDEYSASYRTFSLGDIYTDVTMVEIWLKEFNYSKEADNEHKYVIHIADIRFS